MEKARKPSEMKKRKEVKRAIFDTLYFFSSAENPPGKSSVLVEYMLIVVITIQKISLLYHQEMDLKNWEYYELFWFILSLFRPEFIAISLGYFEVFIYAMAGLLTISLGVLLLTIKTFYQDTEVSYRKIRRILVLFPMSLVSGILEIPLFCVFLVCYRYSGHKTSVEYSISFHYSWHFKTICFAVFLAQCLYIYICKVILYETRHSLTNKVVDARSTGLVDGLSSIVNFLCVFLHFFMLENFPGFAYSLSFSLNAILLYKYLVMLPHYSEKITVAHVISIIVTWVSCVFFMIGRWQNDGHVVFLLLFIINPLLPYPIKHFVLWRIKSLKQIESLSDVSLENYDKLFRFLISDSKLEKFIKNLKENEVFRKDKMLYIWEAYMLNDMKRHNKRARLTLSNSITDEGSIPVKFQFYKCSKFLESSATQVSFKFLKQWNEFEQVKKLDLSICKKITKILSFLLIERPSCLHIKHLIETSLPVAQMVKETYQELIKQDPQNIEMLVLYGSLLHDIFGKKQRGLNVLLKAINITKSRPRFTGLNPLSISNGVILFRCCSDHSLVIEYANSRSLEILGFVADSLIGATIDKIIPEYYHSSHKKFIGRYFTKTTLDIKIPSNFFLMSSEEHIIMVTTQIEIEIYEHTPYFLLTFIPTKEQENEDIIVLAPDSTIIGYTRKVLKRMNKTEEMKNKSFNQVFPDAPNLTMRTYEKVKHKKHLYFYTTYLVIGNSGVYVVKLLRQKEGTAIVDQDLEDVSCPFSLDFMLMGIDPHAHEEEQEEAEDISSGSNMLAVQSEESVSENSENTQLRELGQAFYNRREESPQSSTNYQNCKFTAKKMKKELKLIFSRMKKGFFLILLLVALSAVGFNYSISVYNSSLETDLVVYSILNSSLYAISNASMITRILDLQNRGLGLDLKTISVQSVMESSLATLEESKNLLIEYGISSLVKDPKITLFFWEGGELLIDKVSVHEYFIQLIRHLNVVMENTHLKMDNPSMQFLYLNGLITGLAQLEDTKKACAENLVQNYESLMVIANFNFSLVSVLALSIVILVSIQIKNLGEIYKSLWDRLEKTPDIVLRSKYRSLEDRLALLNKELKDIHGHKSRAPLVPDKIWIRFAVIFIVYVMSSILLLQIVIYFMTESHEKILARDIELTLLMNKHAVNTIKVYQVSSEIPLLDTEYSLYNTIPISFPADSDLAKSSKDLRALTKDLRMAFIQERGSEYEDIYNGMFDKRNSLDLSGKCGIISQSNYFLNLAIGLQQDSQGNTDKISEFLYIGYDIWVGESNLRLDLEGTIMTRIKNRSDLLMIYSITIFSYSVVYFLVALNTCVKKTARFLTSFFLFLKYNNFF